VLMAATGAGGRLIAFIVADEYMVLEPGHRPPEY